MAHVAPFNALEIEYVNIHLVIEFTSSDAILTVSANATGIGVCRWFAISVGSA